MYDFLELSGESQVIEIKGSGRSATIFNSRVAKVQIINSFGGFESDIVVNSCPYRLTGNYKALNWNKIKHHYKFLSDCDFPPIVKDGTVDLLIGTDNPTLSRSLLEKVGGIFEPVARLTPLGWTAIGPIPELKSKSRPGFCYFIRAQNDCCNLSENIKRLCEMQELPTKQEVITPDEKMADEIFDKGLVFLDPGCMHCMESWPP